jgi:hypothetical protein
MWPMRKFGSQCGAVTSPRQRVRQTELFKCGGIPDNACGSNKGDGALQWFVHESLRCPLDRCDGVAAKSQGRPGTMFPTVSPTHVATFCAVVSRSLRSPLRFRSSSVAPTCPRLHASLPHRCGGHRSGSASPEGGSRPPQRRAAEP